MGGADIGAQITITAMYVCDVLLSIEDNRDDVPSVGERDERPALAPKPHLLTDGWDRKEGRNSRQTVWKCEAIPLLTIGYSSFFVEENGTTCSYIQYLSVLSSQQTDITRRRLATEADLKGSS